MFSPPAFHAPINPAPTGRSTWRAALIDLGAIRPYGDWQRAGFFCNRLRRRTMRTPNERPKSAQVVSCISPKNSQVKSTRFFVATSCAARDCDANAKTLADAPHFLAEGNAGHCTSRKSLSEGNLLVIGKKRKIFRTPVCWRIMRNSAQNRRKPSIRNTVGKTTPVKRLFRNAP